MLFEQDRYILAARFAAEAHNGQTVPGTELPYLLHVTLVAMEVTAALAREPGRDSDLAVQCALLHDVVEDAGVTVDELAGTFGRGVADGVQALTKDSSLATKEEKMADSLARIQRQPTEVWMVKLADRITNLQPPPAHWSGEKVVRYREEAVAILDALGDASGFLAERFTRKLATYPGCLGHRVYE